MRSEKVYMMAQMVENKLQDMEHEKQLAYEKFEDFEQQYEEAKLNMVEEEEMLKVELEKVKAQNIIKDIELAELDGVKEKI